MLAAINYPSIIKTSAIFPKIDLESLIETREILVETQVTQLSGYGLDIWTQLGINPGASIYLHFEAQLNMLEQNYKMTDQERIISFLHENRKIIPLLFEAYGQIKKYFPFESLRLMVEKDPEYGKQELIIYIETERQVDDALTRLEQLDQNWWLDELGNTNGLLSIAPSFL